MSCLPCLNPIFFFFNFHHDSCFPLPKIWEFLGATERMCSGRPAGREQREGLEVWESRGWRGVQRVERSGKYSE